jgi:hypothetical protein
VGALLGVGELRVGAVASEAPPFETVVDKAEDGDDEGAKIKEKTSFSLRSVWSLPSVGRSSPRFKPSKELAHWVS